MKTRRTFAEFLYHEPAVAAVLLILVIGILGALGEALAALMGVPA